MDDNSIFLDSNVLVYASVIESPLYQPARKAIIGFLHQGYKCFISRQIIREFLVVLTRPQSIVSTMLTHGIVNLLTQNTDDFRCFNQLINIISIK